MIFLKELVATFLMLVALVFAILSLFKKFEARKWFALTALSLTLIALLFISWTISDYDKNIVSYNESKSLATKRYTDSKNSFEKVTVEFGNYSYDEGKYEFSVSNSKLPITLTNNNETAVEGTLKIDNSYEKAGNTFEYGFSNYVDFELEAGETKTYYALNGVSDKDTAIILSKASFSVNEEGTYSYFEEETDL